VCIDFGPQIKDGETESQEEEGQREKKMVKPEYLKTLR